MSFRRGTFFFRSHLNSWLSVELDFLRIRIISPSIFPPKFHLEKSDDDDANSLTQKLAGSRMSFPYETGSKQPEGRTLSSWIVVSALHLAHWISCTQTFPPSFSKMHQIESFPPSPKNPCSDLVRCNTTLAQSRGLDGANTCTLAQNREFW